MIVSHIIGGLGNQMFQYAAARSLALKRGIPLYLDISAFANYELHQGFELKHIFGINADIATIYELRKILGWQRSPFARRILMRPYLTALRYKGFVVEPHFQYWAELNDVAPESYLVGYWQSERYFSEAATQIRRDFTFSLPMNSLNAEVSAQIISVCGVSLHVRRGDYANNPNTRATHGLCSLDYYRNAVRYISEHVHNPYFFVFSDDIAWVKENLVIGFPCQYVNHNKGAESYNDMRLMSMCQHHIIANSSFSWWGAWLNSKPDKIVIAPYKWFSTNSDVSDLIPRAWVKL